ncbi:MAG: M1 family aminopeptidase [Hyphomicrobiales bacterium]
MRYFFYLTSLFFFFSQYVIGQESDLSKGCVGVCKQHCHSEVDKNKILKRLLPDESIHDYDVKFYFLDLNVTPESTEISGTATIKAEVVADQLPKFSFELIPELDIHSIKVNGESKNFIREVDNVSIKLENYKKGDLIEVAINYSGKPIFGGFFSGINSERYNQSGARVTWTLSEPSRAKQWFPVKQELTDKADSCYVYLTCDSKYMAGSQGILKRVVDLDGDKKRYEWESHYPIAYYLISFAVAEYEEYINYAKPQAMNGDSIPIVNYVYKNQLSTHKPKLDKVPGMIELFSDLYSLYPFHKEKYGHIMAYLGGAMEHQTMSTMGSLEFTISAHELGHQWFGDNVTCGTWNDIWVNEGFASYSEYLALEKLGYKSPAQRWMNEAIEAATRYDSGSTYVPDEEVYEGNDTRIFSYHLTYKKGALLVHMIRNEINDDDKFFNILKTFQKRYANKTALGVDFKEVCEEITGENWDDFFNQWYFGHGYPIYRIKYSQNNNKLIIDSEQTTSSSETPLFKTTLYLELRFEDGSEKELRLKQTKNSEQFEVEVDQKVSKISFDPNRRSLSKISNITTGIIDQKKPSYFLFSPNPTKGIVNINLQNSDQAKLQLVTIDGQIILEKQLTSRNSIVDLSTIDKGLYLIKVGSQDYETVRKIIVK